MPIKDVALICLNGQIINQSRIKNTENNTQYCETCGVKNISKGMECSEIIREEIYDNGVFDWDEIKPSYCHECGTQNPFKALIEMVKYFELNAENAEN
jgi:hypothetical protein